MFQLQDWLLWLISVLLRNNALNAAVVVLLKRRGSAGYLNLNIRLVVCFGWRVLIDFNCLHCLDCHFNCLDCHWNGIEIWKRKKWRVRETRCRYFFRCWKNIVSGNIWRKCIHAYFGWQTDKNYKHHLINWQSCWIHYKMVLDSFMSNRFNKMVLDIMWFTF